MIQYRKSDSRQYRRNECLRLIRISNRVINEVRSSSSESREHIAKKEEICANLEQQKKHYVTEAILVSIEPLRADILVLDDFKAIEIAKTESEESLRIKRDKYARLGLKMEVVRI